MASAFGYIRFALCLMMALLGNITASLSMGPASVSEMAARLTGAVVNISTSRQIPNAQGEAFPTLPDGSALRELFDGLNPNAGQGEQAMRQARSLGSGFLISADGHIVTNNHVIKGADEILIYTAKGQRYVADVIGADEKTDLAVLKITTNTPLPFVEFGDSDTAKVGDWVMAVGNPFGLGGSVSLGIVSARNRHIDSGPYDDFIQTDAAINLGNSGGPLFDMNGKVVGIVTAIIAQGGSSRGIGFAVPVNLAHPIISQLSEFGETRRGWLGVGIQGVSEEMAASLGQSSAVGALVVEVTPGGPSAGILQPGDVILLFEGEPILEMRNLPQIVAQTPVGKSVSVQVIREGELVELNIELGQLEVGEKLAAAQRQTQDSLLPDEPIVDEGRQLSPAIQDLLGFSILPLTSHIRNVAGFGAIRGLFVARVENGSENFEKGIRSGLVITAVDQVLVETVEQFESAIENAQTEGRESILLKLRDSSGISRLIAVNVGEN